MQKLTSLSPGNEFLAVGTTDDRVAILRYPTLEPAVPTIELQSELVDLDWGGEDGKWVSCANIVETKSLAECAACCGHDKVVIALSTVGRKAISTSEANDIPTKYRHHTRILPFSKVS